MSERSGQVRAGSGRRIRALGLAVLAVSLLVWAAPVGAESHGEGVAWDDGPAGYAVAREAGLLTIDWADAPAWYGLTQWAGNIRVNWADAPAGYAVARQIDDVMVDWGDAPAGYAVARQADEVMVDWGDAPVGYALAPGAVESCAWLDAPAGFAISAEDAAAGLAEEGGFGLAALCLADGGLGRP